MSKKKKRYQHPQPNSQKTSHPSLNRRSGGTVRQSAMRDPSGRGFPPPADRHWLIGRLQAIPAENRTPDDWYTLGSLLIYEGCLEDDDKRIQEGSKGLIKAAQANPPVPDAVLDLVWLMNLRGLPAMAVEYAKKATELMPEERDAWRFRANTHLQLDESKEAIESLRKAVSLPGAFASDRELLADLESGQAVTERPSIILFGLPTEDCQLRTSDSSEYDLDALKLSLFYTRQFLQLHPDHVQARYDSALCHYHLRRFEEAERDLVQLLHTDPKHVEGWVLKALCGTKKNADLDTIQHHYETALGLDPSHVLANSNLAKIFLDRDQPARARPLLDAVLKTEPNYAPAISMYGNTLALLEHDYARDLEYQTKALALAPETLEIHYCYVISLLQGARHWQLKKEWKRHEPYVRRTAEQTGHPVPKLALLLVPALIDPPSDVMDCLQLTKLGREVFGGKAVAPLIHHAFKLRHQLPSDPQEKVAFLTHMGVEALHCEEAQLSYEILRAAELIEGPGGGATLNVAVALSRLGDHAAGLKLARQVRETTLRFHTMIGNLYDDAGQPELALASYREAARREPDFDLSITNGISIAIKTGDMDALTELAGLARDRFPGIPAAQHSLAAADLACGFPSEAADGLIQMLYEGGEPKWRSASDSDSDEELPNVAGPSDVWVKRPFSLTNAFKLLGICLVKSRRFDDFSQLQRWIIEKGRVDGDWNVISAECLRLIGNDAEAIAWVEQTSDQPPPCATRALIAAAKEDWSTALNAVNRVFAPEFTDKVFSHPEGLPEAIAHTVRAMHFHSQGFTEDAIAEATRGIAIDRTCGISHQVLAQIHAANGEETEAIAAAVRGLQCVPGYPTLVRWLVDYLIERGQALRADELLLANRSQLRSRGRSDLGLFLSDQIARARLPAEAPVPATSIFCPDWMDRLEPQSQGWLRAAVEGSQKVRDMRLAVALYYCKILERELTAKLIEPFFAGQPEGATEWVEVELQELQKSLIKWRQRREGSLPSLGALVYALRKAMTPLGLGESRFLQSWRLFLEELEEPRRTAARDPSFIDQVEQLKTYRNRVMHQGDLNEQEFNQVASAILNNDRPGAILLALGIG
jgi:tetratricopeptide (TPR) repeat protein